MTEHKRRIQAVDDGFDFGVYMWKFSDGSHLSDGNGNYLNVPGRRFDMKAMADLSREVRSYGIEDGGPVFIPGVTRVTEEEYAEDLERFSEGKTPYGDFGAYKDGNKRRR